MDLGDLVNLYKQPKSGGNRPPAGRGRGGGPGHPGPSPHLPHAPPGYHHPPQMYPQGNPGPMPHGNPVPTSEVQGSVSRYSGGSNSAGFPMYPEESGAPGPGGAWPALNWAKPEAVPTAQLNSMYLPGMNRGRGRGGPSNRSLHPPAKELFRCDACDKGFAVKTFFDKHVANHIPCPYEGCSFSAVKAVMKSHELIHMRSMFSKLETPEEIAKYREERKKRYPTNANVQKKIDEAKQLGIVVEDSNAGRGRGRGRGRDRPARGGRTGPAGETNATAPSAADNDKKRKRRPVCKYYKQGKCSRGEHCTFSHEGPQFPGAKRQKLSDPREKASNLLGKLLEDESDNEKRVILQCLQYIMAHNFFAPAAARAAIGAVPQPKEDATMQNSTADHMKEDQESDGESDELEEGEMREDDEE